jgi:hypothetical protein
MKGLAQVESLAQAGQLENTPSNLLYTITPRAVDEPPND